MFDSKKLMIEIETVMGVIYPTVDKDKISVNVEQILSNYDIRRKFTTEFVNDFADKIELYLSAIKVEGHKENTINGYKMELTRFSKFVNKAAEQVETDDIRAYLSSKKNWMLSTVDRKLSQIRSFYKWLVKEEILLRNPAVKINPPKLPKRLPKGLSIEELEMVREACVTKRERALVEVFYSTACRLSELKNLKIDDINFTDQSIRVIGKGDVERTVYLSEKSYYYLRKYLETRRDNCEFIFVTIRRPYRQMQNRTIEDVIEKIRKRVNMKKKLTPHVFRHSFATQAVNNGADLADVQHLLGHSNPATTLIYAKVSEERKKQAHKRFHVQ